MKDQACEPCAKRKVRCDKGEPCSNCKRRKQDQCTYQEASPFDRIKKLEALVQRLGGDPQNDVQCAGKPTGKAPSPSKSRHHLQHDRQEKASFTESRSKDPVVLEEDGQSFYLESCVSSLRLRDVVDFEGVHGMAGTVMARTTM